MPEFAVNEGEHFVIEQWLQKRLLLDGISTPSCFSSDDWPVIQDPTTTSMESEFAQPVVGSPLDKIFANLAAGATTYIRQCGGSSQLNIADFRQCWREVDYDKDLALDDFPMDEALGTANETPWQRETQTKVCWQWIALPVSLMIVTVAFLLMTALQTKKRGVDAWKSSNIPIFCSGLDSKVQEKLCLHRILFRWMI